MKASHRYGKSHAIWDHTMLPATNSGDFPAFTPTEVGTQFSDSVPPICFPVPPIHSGLMALYRYVLIDWLTPEGCKAELTWVVLYPKIVYLLKTVTYLRNNQAVSWPAFEPVTESRESDVLTTTPPTVVHKRTGTEYSTTCSTDFSIKLLLLSLLF